MMIWDMVVSIGSFGPAGNGCRPAPGSGILTGRIPARHRSRSEGDGEGGPVRAATGAGMRPRRSERPGHPRAGLKGGEIMSERSFRAGMGQILIEGGRPDANL